MLMMIETELFAFESDSRWCRLCPGSDADGCDGECLFDLSSVAKEWQLYLYTVEAQPSLAQDEAAQQQTTSPFQGCFAPTNLLDKEYAQSVLRSTSPKCGDMLTRRVCR